MNKAQAQRLVDVQHALAPFIPHEVDLLIASIEVLWPAREVKPQEPQAHDPVLKKPSLRQTRNVTAAMADARVRYNDWTAEIEIGEVRDTDEVILVMGKDLFNSQRGARVIAGNIMEVDPLWKSLKTQRGYNKKRYGGARIWMRLPLPTATTKATRRAKATLQKKKQRQRARHNSEAHA